MLAVAPVVGVASPAHADDRGGNTAVIGPLLDFFGFGTSVGAPVFCNTGSASIGSGFQEFGATEQGNTLVDGINKGCSTFSEQGGALVRQGKSAQAPYASQFNPVANPVIGRLSDATTQFGTTFGPALAPFGPTVAGTGATMKFLKGSGPDRS